MTLRIAATIVLCLSLSVPGLVGVLFTDGPVDGYSNAFFIDGPTGPYGQTISDQFVATTSGAADSLDFGVWVTSNTTPTSIGWALGTTALGTEIGSGFEPQVAFTYLNSNGYGYFVYLAHVDDLSGFLVAGQTYYLTLSRGNNSTGDQMVAWDMNNGSAGCYFGVGGSYMGGCGAGGEAFTLYSADVPEPASVILLSAGLFLLAGFVRRGR